jgi:hypothetical protein
MKNIFIFLLIISQAAIGQRLKKTDRAIIENLKSEITYLSSDQLQGRRTGTAGEKMASEYLSDQFKNIGLIPKGDEGSFIQNFEINEGKQILPSTFLILNNDSLVLQKDFFPFIFSSNTDVKGDASLAFKEKGMPWFWDIRESVEENKGNPHFDLSEMIRQKAIEFSKMGASACIVFNSGDGDESLHFEGKSRINPLNIPVVFLNKNASQKYLNDNSANLNVDLHIAIADKKRTGRNVIGYLDNGKANTIIIGAHYDHLGSGEDQNSLWTGKPEIHNGADDNASGTAIVIELARQLKNSKLKDNNYLFVCFSGEELGLFGSKYFTQNPTIPLDAVSFMINFDMVGKLNSNRTITVGGYGTSPTWGKILPEKTKTLEVKFDSSGIGPSDHTSFYLKNIPVLFFFTGTHSDYHKPTDDVEKINFTGELYILQYVMGLLQETNKNDKLVFSKTREPQMGASPHFTMTLGIMPDYTYAENGLRIDAIVDDRVAQKAGMNAGDVIVQIGDFKVTDINNYMTALSKFKKGDSATVTVLRGNQQKKFDIVF